MLNNIGLPGLVLLAALGGFPQPHVVVGVVAMQVMVPNPYPYSGLAFITHQSQARN